MTSTLFGSTSLCHRALGTPTRLSLSDAARRTCRLLVLIGLVVGGAGSVSAGDWPMWRGDAGRTAASGEVLPEGLTLSWTRQGTPREQAWDDPLNLDLMPYDRVFEPIVLDGRMFVADTARDKVMAIDTKTGKELWSYFTDAPVRMPPVGWNGHVFFAGDDGRMHCVDAASGKLQWQFQGAPGPRKVIGNERLISAWPARGGAVIRDGKLYFATSIWPFMGVFIYSLDAETGDIEWVNDSTGASYIRQPHSAPSFAGVGPQGMFVATEKDLIVPGGRSVPAVFDRATGDLRYFELNAGGKGTGGSFVAATDSAFFVHTRLKGVREFNLEDGKKTAFQPNEPVLHGDFVYTAEADKSGKPFVRAYNAKRDVVWEIAADGSGDLILAGNTLYAAGPKGIVAIRLPAEPVDQSSLVVSDANRPQVVQAIAVPGVDSVGETIERLLAADGKLFAVTLDGRIMAFGATGTSAGSQPMVIRDQPQVPAIDAAKRAQAGRLLAPTAAEGFALWFGADDESLVMAMAAESPFEQLAIVDGDAARVDGLRRGFDQAGWYGRVTAHRAEGPEAFDAAPYLAHLVVIGESLSERLADQPKSLAATYQSVRPYGGVLHLLAPAERRDSIAAMIQEAGLEQADVAISEDGVVVRRVGSLPGAANWTHQHGDIGNTRKSDDTLVKLPLGILWFGGSSHMDVLPRHGHGPPQQVIGGRLFIQGINVLSARDVYTGRVLWRREFEDLGTHDVYYDDTYAETPLDPSYNQVHIPGSNARGTNYVVTEDRVYLVEGSVCRVLDPATGETIQTIELPQDDPENPHEWSYIGVYDDVLIGGLGFARYRDRLELSFDEEDGKLSGSKAGFGSKSLDRAGSLALVGFDRITGKRLWQVDARHSFWNNAIVAGRGKIYCLDKNPKPVEQKLARRGTALPSSYRLMALDARTGRPAWEVTEGIFGTFLNYSERLDLLLQGGAAASDRLAFETDRGMTVYRGSDGEVQWSKPDLKYSGPCILHNDLIITNANSYSQSAGSFYLETGEPYLISNPLTGDMEHWKLTRAYGCNTILASENLLTFRSGAAGFYDMTTHGGTGNFGGFKSGCTGNLIAAGGVLNAPDYTRTCSCSYQNQTSLALVHMPDVETWTVNPLALIEGKPRRVQSLGVNFAAPGHHRSPEGLLWIEGPGAAGDEPPLKVTIGDGNRPFRRHSSALSDSDYPWIFASGIEGEGEIRVGTLIGKEKKAKDEDDAKKGKTVETEPVAQVDPIPYRIRLFFGVPADGPTAGARTFDVLIDGKKVLEDVRIGDGETLIREVPSLPLRGELRLQLVAKEGTPLISGIEMVQLP